jgi:hypothetical protein
MTSNKKMGFITKDTDGYSDALFKMKDGTEKRVSCVVDGADELSARQQMNDEWSDSVDFVGEIDFILEYSQETIDEKNEALVER